MYQSIFTAHSIPKLLNQNLISAQKQRQPSFATGLPMTLDPSEEIDQYLLIPALGSERRGAEGQGQ